MNKSDKKLLDFFAGCALQGMLATYEHLPDNVKLIAEVSHIYARAMLAESKKEENQ